MSDKKSRIICSFNDDWRFCRLAKKDGLSSLAAVSAELFVNGTSMGTSEGQNGSTVFTWENIKTDCGKENIISVRAKFADGSVIEDNAVWTGCLSR